MTNATCNMRTGEPYDFAWCEAHDETFPLGGICPEERGRLGRVATGCHARGDWQGERDALDQIHLDDQARSRA